MRTMNPRDVRPSAIAGSWYPGSRAELARTVDGYLANVEDGKVEGQVLGLISPHAGYIYSGQVAAYAYKQLEGCQFDTVILVGPSHRIYVGDYAVAAATYYETPLGRVKVDEDFVGDLADEMDLPHVWETEEHCLEIQLPFLQRVLDDFAFVPILMSARTLAACQALADAIVTCSADRCCLIVASSDLHHIPGIGGSRVVEQRDAEVVHALSGGDVDHVARVLLKAEHDSVCGRMPIITALLTGQGRGATRVEVLRHTNSAEVTGQGTASSYTVGYAAAVILAGRG